MFLNSNIFLQSEFSNLSHIGNLQEQVKKVFCYQKLFWPFTAVWINCPSDLNNLVNSWPSASNFKSFSWSQEYFFLTVGQDNFGNKIPFSLKLIFFLKRFSLEGAHCIKSNLKTSIILNPDLWPIWGKYTQ